MKKAAGTATEPSVPADSPEEILARGFARGELDIESYRVQRSVLARAREGEG